MAIKFFEKLIKKSRRSTERPHLHEAIIKWLNEADIKIVDVGARGNSLPEFDLISECSHLYACEPDVEEAVRITPVLKNKWKKVTVFSEALYNKEGDSILNITQRKGLSSLLPPNHDVVTRYYPGDSFYSITDTLKVHTIPLSIAAKKYGFSDAAFIKIDTQGTELDILKSGEDLLKDTVLGIHIEVEFHEFYLRQSLFSEIDRYLSSLGFSLFDLEKRFLRRASYDEKLYSRRQIVWGNALYLKEPTAISSKQESELYLKQLKRLFAVSLSFGYFDLALEILEKFITTNGMDEISTEIKKYMYDVTNLYVASNGPAILNHGSKEPRIR